MAQRYRPRGVRFAFVYTHEAHPSDEWPHHQSLEQKRAHARHMADRWSIARPMLVDDLAGTVHRAYGSLPNMTYILHRGRILYRASWTHEQTIRLALDEWLGEERQASGGAELAPYWVEWAPRSPSDRRTFLDALHREVGRRAVEEFIEAVAATHGARRAAPLRRWWAEIQGVATEP